MKITKHPLMMGATGIAALALANWMFARATERKNPPLGSFVTVDGIKLHYTEHGQGKPVVLIHGNGVFSDDWKTSGVTDLLAQSRKVIAFDRPGYGYSERPRGKAWTATQQAELLHKAIEQLEIKQPILVGHSLGATVALAYATNFQSDLTGIVLVSGYYFPTLRPDSLMAATGAIPGVSDLLRYTVSPLLGWLQIPFLKRAMFMPAKVPSRFKEKYSSAMALRPSQIRASSVDGAMMAPSVFGMSWKYKNITIPVAIIAGDKDHIVLKKTAERLQTKISQSTLTVVPGAGHMIHYFKPSLISTAVDQIADIKKAETAKAPQTPKAPEPPKTAAAS